MYAIFVYQMPLSLQQRRYNVLQNFARQAAGAAGRRAASAASSMFRYQPYGTANLKRMRSMETRRMRKFVKRVVNRSKETHFVDFFWGKTELYHNSYASPFPCFRAQVNIPSGCLPPQGDGDSNRTGNDIQAKGIQVKCMFGCKQDRHNCTFRVMALRVTKGYDTGPYGNVFDNQTGNIMLDGVDKDRVSVLFDKKVHYKPINPSPDGKEITVFKKFWIPHNTSYKFYDDGTQSNSYPYDIYFIVMAYDAYGTLTTDNIGYVQTWSRFYFKDK